MHTERVHVIHLDSFPWGMRWTLADDTRFDRLHDAAFRRMFYTGEARRLHLSRGRVARTLHVYLIVKIIRQRGESIIAHECRVNDANNAIGWNNGQRLPLDPIRHRRATLVYECWPENYALIKILDARGQVTWNTPY